MFPVKLLQVWKYVENKKFMLEETKFKIFLHDKLAGVGKYPATTPVFWYTEYTIIPIQQLRSESIKGLTVYK